MTMNKFLVLSLVIMLVTMSGACSGATLQPVNEPITPEEKIGDLLITTGDGEDVTYVTQLHCPYEESTGTESCELPVGTKVNISQGIFAPSSGEMTLDEIWSGMTYEMTIEGYTVNLQAFGPIEFTNPVVGTVRVWNVVIVTNEPATITAHSTGVVGGDSIEYTAKITFTRP
jgi:hypothetical protein